MANNNSSAPTFGSFLYVLMGIFSACVGYHMHHSIFFALCDWIFWPLVWLKWLICHQVNLTIIHDTFSYFLS